MMLTISESKKSDFRIGLSKGIVLVTRFHGMCDFLYINQPSTHQNPLGLLTVLELQLISTHD